MLDKVAISRLWVMIIIAIVIVAGVVGGVSYYFLVVKAPPTTTKTSIVVGWVHGITGYLSGLTAVLDIYYKEIIEDYNKKYGGLYDPDVGKNLTLTYIEYDDQSDISNCISLTEKLITVDHVDLIFGPCSTAFNFAVFPIYQEYHYPVVSTTFGSDIAADEMRSGQLSYCFSVLGFPAETGEQVLSFLQYINSTKAPGSIRSVGIINDNDQHGVEYGAAIYSALYLAGFSIPVHESYLESISDFTPIIDDLKAANVTVVVNCGYEGGLFVRQCISEGYCPKLMFNGPGMEVPELVYYVYDFTKTNLIGLCQYDGWPTTAYNTPALAAWAAAEKNRTGYYPFPASAVFYAGLQCLFLAVEKVGLNHEKIRDALATDTFNTLVGATHLVQGSYMRCSLAGTIVQWQGGDMMQVVWPLNASTATIIYPKTSW
jgi:branched-chain amino acid transport system substrate-binding protein